MRIESINIRNMRQLKDVSLRFGRDANKNDIHVLLAENGIGKTNIVNAITWCLYNKETHLRNESTALSIVNNQVVNNLRTNGGGRVEVYVGIDLSIDDNIDTITIERKANYNITTDAILPLHDELSITMMEGGGYRIIKEKEETAQIIHKYLPEEINNYIFFDGEQLENFFSQDQIKNVQEGINELTQASYLAKASTFLNKYVSGEIIPKYKEANDEELNKQQKKVSDLKDEIKNNINTIGEFQIQIDKCGSQIDELSNKIRGFEDIKERMEELENLENDINKIHNQLKDNSKELMIFTREYYNILALYPSLKVFYDYIIEQDKNGNLPPRVDKKLLRQILSTKHCPFCNTENLDTNHLEHVKKLEISLAVASSTSAELNRALGSLSSYIEKTKKYKSEKEKLIQAREKTVNLLKEKDGRYQELSKYLQTIPNEQEIVRAITQRQEFRKLKEELIGKKGGENAIKEQNEANLKIEENKLQSLINKHAELKKYERQKTFCELCASYMEKCRVEILDECRLKIQEETFDIFNQLVWKKNYFSKINILEDYSFELLDRYGNQCLGSCSAAETALLALSFTLALQDVSKHDSLLFIDTPIGRVGKENRKNFMETLLEVSKDKQVILTFTPTEYDDNVQSILSVNYSTFQKLEMNSEGVTIKI